MKKLIILTTSLVLLMVFILPFILALGIKIIPGGDQPGYDVNNKRGIYTISSVSQPFTSQEGNLTAIGISLGNPNLKNQKEIKFNLFDSSGNQIRSTSLNGLNVGDGAFVKFIFDPIQDSKNKGYVFTLSSPSAGTEEVVDIFVSTGHSDWIGPASYGKEVLTNGLPIVAYYKPASHLKVAAGIYSDWIKRLLSRSQLPGY